MDLAQTLYLCWVLLIQRIIINFSFMSKTYSRKKNPPTISNSTIHLFICYVFQPYSPNLPFLKNLLFWIFCMKTLDEFTKFKILNLAIYTIFLKIATSQGDLFALKLFAKPWTSLFHFCHMTVFACQFLSKFSPSLSKPPFFKRTLFCHLI